MRVLGIESSCDETAVAVVRDGTAIEASLLYSQNEEHLPFGGVVPEIASRAHLVQLPRLLRELERASGSLAAIDAVAVTARPGLIGSLLVGVSAAKALAWSLGKPLVDVHHVQAHVYAAQMEHPRLAPPFVALVVSGGHTSLYLCTAPGVLEEIGSTMDDAAGEAFDKVASLLGLPYPGGPAIEGAARSGDAAREPFLAARVKGRELDFSFSGLKTAMLYRIAGQNVARKNRPAVPAERVPHLAAGFQEAVVGMLVERSLLAARQRGVAQIAVGGGVACNQRLRAVLGERAGAAGLEVFFPSLPLCLDNAAMIAGLGFHLLREGRRAPFDLDACPR
ncbi:MAG: tRNA (adenosine(37)-N6)-threonylcarbamoyltransferase complex transferase subunit TsaD [Planctomycetes bacterium]|nr:tRNA (adenosine(37)-N6)-threonylcarbamoyltransferase complex transferase subunit TsaD [Planctomycetota bacterium]